MIYSLLGQIREFGPDVIHFQGGELWFNFALPLLKRWCPLVITIHDPAHHPGDALSQKTPQAVLDLGYHQADRVIVHSGSLKQTVIDRLGIPAEIVHVIPHIALGDESDQARGQENSHSVLFFGRIWEYKGLDYLIRAEPLITKQVPEARIVIAGEGEDFGRYRRIMVHPDRFDVHNEYIADDRRAELFQEAAVVVLPYVEASQSGVIPVAYTFSKPVVATRVGGLPEMVDDGQTGYLVPPRDEIALAWAVVRLLQNADLRHRLGSNGKRKIETECSPDVVASKTLGVYRSAVSTESTRARAAA
jgi:starch synthase